MPASPSTTTSLFEMATMHTRTNPFDEGPPEPTYRFSGDQPPAALAHLRDEPRWVGWKYEERNCRSTKPPIDPRTGRYASVSNSQTWATFETALDGVKKHGLAGVGLMLTGDGIIGIDLDDCVTDSGSYSPLAAD